VEVVLSRSVDAQAAFAWVFFASLIVIVYVSASELSELVSIHVHVKSFLQEELNNAVLKAPNKYKYFFILIKFYYFNSQLDE
jgi:hypothetical protein